MIEDGVEVESPPGLAFVALTGLTMAVLAGLVILVVLPLLSRRAAPVRPAHSPAVAIDPAGLPQFSHQRTVVYLVSSSAEAARLDGALSEWRLEVEALGVAGEQPRRVVVVQTPDEVFHQRVIDFTLLAAQAPGLDLQVIDLRDGG